MYLLDSRFEPLREVGKNRIFLNKYSGDWFSIKNDYVGLVEIFKTGLSHDDVRSLKGDEREILFQLKEAGHFKLKKIKDGYTNDKVTLVIIEPLSFCNLSCSYCFEDVPTEGIKMSENTADRIISKIEQLDLFNCLTIEFNGGEAFVNMPIIEYFIQKCLASEIISKNKLIFTVQSNATIFSEKVINFFKKYDVRIGVSIDGTKEDHDRNRFFKSGRGSHDLVMKGVDKLKKNGIDFSVD